jgi:hypothetical protein
MNIYGITVCIQLVSNGKTSNIYLPLHLSRSKESQNNFYTIFCIGIKNLFYFAKYTPCVNEIECFSCVSTLFVVLYFYYGNIAFYWRKAVCLYNSIFKSVKLSSAEIMPCSNFMFCSRLRYYSNLMGKQNVKYGVSSPKFAWAPCAREFGLIYEGAIGQPR